MDACRRTVSSYSDICRPIRGPHDTWKLRAVAYLSHACAILACALAPTLITFIGRMPGMIGGGSQVTLGCCSVYTVSRVLGGKPPTKRCDFTLGKIRDVHALYPLSKTTKE